MDKFNNVKFVHSPTSSGQSNNSKFFEKKVSFKEQADLMGSAVEMIQSHNIGNRTRYSQLPEDRLR